MRYYTTLNTKDIIIVKLADSCPYGTTWHAEARWLAWTIRVRPVILNRLSVFFPWKSVHARLWVAGERVFIYWPPPVRVVFAASWKARCLTGPAIRRTWASSRAGWNEWRRVWGTRINTTPRWGRRRRIYARRRCPMQCCVSRTESNKNLLVYDNKYPGIRST